MKNDQNVTKLCTRLFFYKLTNIWQKEKNGGEFFASGVLRNNSVILGIIVVRLNYNDVMGASVPYLQEFPTYLISCRLKKVELICIHFRMEVENKKNFKTFFMPNILMINIYSWHMFINNVCNNENQRF